MSDSSVLDNIAPVSTVARKVIDYLMGNPDGTEVTAAQGGELTGQPSSGFGSYLAPAVRAGLLERRVSQGVARWRLGHNIDADARDLLRSSAGGDDERVVRSAPATAFSSVFAYAASRGAAPFSVALHTDGRLEAQRHGRTVCEFTDEERRILIVAGAQGVAAR